MSGSHDHPGSDVARARSGVGESPEPGEEVNSSGRSLIYLCHTPYQSPGHGPGVEGLRPGVETHHVLRTPNEKNRLCGPWYFGFYSRHTSLSPAWFASWCSHIW